MINIIDNIIIDELVQVFSGIKKFKIKAINERVIVAQINCEEKPTIFVCSFEKKIPKGTKINVTRKELIKK